MAEVTALIDRQIAAYNARDLDGFVACYAVGARIVQPEGSYLALRRGRISAAGAVVAGGVEEGLQVPGPCEPSGSAFRILLDSRRARGEALPVRR